MTGAAMAGRLSSDRSVRLELETIAVIGVSIGVIARELEAVEASVRSLWTRLEEATWLAHLYPGEAIAATRLSATRCELAREHVGTLAEDARTAAETYAAAERDNVRVIAQLQALSAWKAGLDLRFSCFTVNPFAGLGQVGSFVQQAKDEGLRQAGMGALAKAPGYLAALLGADLGISALVAGLAGAPQPATPTLPMVAGLRKLLDRAGVFQPGDLTVRKLPPSSWLPHQPDGPSGPAGPAAQVDEERGWAAGATPPSIQGVLKGTQDAYAVAPSSIIVREVDRGDGTTLWIVDLPGTEAWTPLDSENIWDVEGDLEAMTSAQRGEFAQKNAMVADLVKQALADAGASAGEDVLITGHSGGGIHAAAMAADPAFLANVNVRMIVIAGAPGANSQPGPGIDVLDLENTDDMVTALAGAQPEQTEHWTTVVSERRPGADTGDLAGLAANAHKLDGYLDDAAALDASADPAYAAAKERLDAVLGTAAVSTGVLAYKQYVYQGKDVAKPPSHPDVRRVQEGR